MDGLLRRVAGVWLVSLGVAAQEPATVEKIIAAATNDLRAAQGRARLAVDPQLTATAKAFATYLAQHDRLDHDADGRQPGDRARQHGYAWCNIAENIAYEYRSKGFAARELAETLVEDWEGSPGHRRNLLDARVVDLGVGVARSHSSGRWYGVQVFGRRCR